MFKTDVTAFARRHEGRFELVTFHHSLEHIPDQFGALQAAANLLTRNGACIVRIPALPCRAWDVYGTDWVELDAPRHLYIHSRSSITTLAERAGLRLEQLGFDTTAFEFFGSEQYKQDVPLSDPSSLWINPESPLFTEEEKRRFEDLARTANQTKTAGRAVFMFRKT